MTQKQACPKDADETVVLHQCNKIHHPISYLKHNICTRKKGHETDKSLKNPEEHHAHDQDGYCWKVWK